MRPALWSVLLQALGSGATFGAAALVAWRFGLAAQGEFGLLRTWTDALAVALALGLPQGLLHLQYREEVPASVLLAWARRYLQFLTTGMLAVVGLLLWHSPLAPSGRGLQAATIAMALPFAVTGMLCRSFVLRERGLVPYAAVTSLPSLLIFAGTVGMCVTGQPSGFEWVLLAAAVISASVNVVLVRNASPPAAPVMHVPTRILWSISLQTWVQGLMAALLPALLLTVVGWRGATLAQVGIVSLGLQIYQLFGVLAAYSAPMIYDRLARAVGPVSVMAIFSARRPHFGASVAGGLVVVALLGPWVVARLLPSLGVHLQSITMLAVAGLISLMVRLLWTVSQARGQIRELSIQAIWRLALACGLAGALVPTLGAALTVPLALLIVETLTLGRLAISLHLFRTAAVGTEGRSTKLHR